MYVYMCVYIYICMCVYIYMYVSVCIYIYMYTYTVCGLKTARGHISSATKGTLMVIWLNDKSLTYAQLRVF
jgi:hypothetical protein